MAVRPREKLVLTVELLDKSVKVSGYFYEGLDLVSSSGVYVPLDVEAREYVRLSDLLDEVLTLRKRVTFLAAQPPLPL